MCRQPRGGQASSRVLSQAKKPKVELCLDDCKVAMEVDTGASMLVTRTLFQNFFENNGLKFA